MEKTCFDCESAVIIETASEWIDCLCNETGKWCSPYRPVCKNWPENVTKPNEQV